MASDNGRVSLSAIDLLGLTKQRKVARLDLADAGYEGVMYVRDLTAAEQSKVTGTGGKGGKARYYTDKSYEIDLAALTEAAGPKFLMAAAVTDEKDGEILERAFDAAGPNVEYIMVSAGDLVQMADAWIREAGNIAKAEKALEAMPNAVTNMVVKAVRELSGMAEDRIEEKKENS
jgi:hypothetical protein